MERYQYFNGLKFKKEKDRDYYYHSSWSNSMHRYVWEYYHGKIPKGMHIHHIDGDKSNNDISNLELMDGSKHVAYHSELFARENKDWIKENLSNNAQPKAIEWHGSEEGHEWHKGQYKKYLGKWQERRVEKTCEQCGDTFKTIDTKSPRFCSNKCKAKWRRESGVDDVERECLYCGQKFVINKYSKTKYCSKKCTKTHYWKKQKMS